MWVRFGKRDNMDTSNASFVKKVISSAMALALTVTMMPAAAFAADADVRAEAAPETPEVINQTHPVKDDGADATAYAADAPADEAIAEGSASSAGEQAPASEQDADASSAQVTASVPAVSGAVHVERVNGTVKLQQTAGDVATFINYAGLIYAVDPADPGKVALAGWSIQPSGTLNIPPTISYNGENRIVAGIVRGGVQCINLW